MYDQLNKKDLTYYKIRAAIGKLPNDERKNDKSQYEMLAMDFSEDYEKDEWGTYFGPVMVGKDKDGNPVYYPDISTLTSEHIAYWEHRATETCNPYMQMRYLGLVNDFKKIVTGIEPDYRQIKLRYVESIVEVIDGDYSHYPIDYFTLIGRAFDCAKALHNVLLIARVKETYFRLNARYKDELETPGYWANIMEVLLKNQDVFTPAEQEKIVTENEDRYRQLYQLSLQNGRKTDNYAHLVHDETKLLCQYYEKTTQKDKIAPCIKGLHEALHAAEPCRGAMWYQSMLSQVQELYRKYHLYKEANRLYVDIQNCGEGALQSMEEFRVEMRVSQEDIIDGLLRYMLAGTPAEAMSRFIKENTPNLEHEKEYQANKRAQVPFLYKMATTLYNSQGLPQSKCGGEEDDWNSFMREMAEGFVLKSYFMRKIIEGMEKANILTYETVMQRLDNVPFLETGHREIVDRGVKAYFDGDLLLACHLLIPQFEAAIRQIVLMNGGEVLRSNSDAQDGDEYKSLEGLLSSEEIKMVFTEDEIVYFKNLFTAKAGANFRNAVSHGLFCIERFDYNMADRVLHAFLVLTNAQLS